MRERLGESLASIGRTDKPIDEATTASLEALKAFSLGDEKRNTGSDQEAIPLFKRAIELDPNFAAGPRAAWDALLEPRGNRSRRSSTGRGRTSCAIASASASACTSSGHYYSGVSKEIDKALETYDLWKQTYPRDPVPYINSGHPLRAARRQRTRPPGLPQRHRARPHAARGLRKCHRQAYIEMDRLDEARALRRTRRSRPSATRPKRSSSSTRSPGGRTTPPQRSRYAALLKPMGRWRQPFSRFAAPSWRMRDNSASRMKLLRATGRAPEAAGVAAARRPVAISSQAAARRNAGADTTSPASRRKPPRPFDREPATRTPTSRSSYAVLGEPDATARRLFATIKPEDIPDAALARSCSPTSSRRLLAGTSRPVRRGDPTSRRAAARDEASDDDRTALFTRAEVFQKAGRWAGCRARLSRRAGATAGAPVEPGRAAGAGRTRTLARGPRQNRELPARSTRSSSTSGRTQIQISPLCGRPRPRWRGSGLRNCHPGYFSVPCTRAPGRP